MMSFGNTPPTSSPIASPPRHPPTFMEDRNFYRVANQTIEFTPVMNGSFIVNIEEDPVENSFNEPIGR